MDSGKIFSEIRSDVKLLHVDASMDDTYKRIMANLEILEEVIK